MKIRTDFVTNSSSSSFCVEVCVTDKNGNSYSFADDPYDYSRDYGGTAYFNGGLKRALNEYSYLTLLDAISKDFELDDNRDKAKIKRAENLHVGAKVVLTLAKYHKHPDGSEVKISVSNKSGILGTFYPWNGGEAIAEAIKGNEYDVEGVVTYVVPLSKRRKNAKKPLIMIRILAHEKEQTVEDKNKILAFDSVRELCDFLTSSVDDDFDRYEHYDEYDEYLHLPYHDKEMKKVKESFTQAVTNNIENLSDIQSITVTRHYTARGEFADLIADNDEELCRLAKKVKETSEEEHSEALKEMLQYIKTPNGNRAETFGNGFSDFRYNWNGDDSDLEKLADRLCSFTGPDSVSGTEFSTLDVTTGELTEYAIFDLDNERNS